MGLLVFCLRFGGFMPERKSHKPSDPVWRSYFFNVNHRSSVVSQGLYLLASLYFACCYLGVWTFSQVNRFNRVAGKAAAIILILVISSAPVCSIAEY